MFRGRSADGQFTDSAAPPLDEQGVLRFREEMLQRKMGLGGCVGYGVIPQNGIGFHCTSGSGLVPEQGDSGIGIAGGQTVLRKIVFQHKNSFNSSTSKYILSLISWKVHIKYFRTYQEL